MINYVKFILLCLMIANIPYAYPCTYKEIYSFEESGSLIEKSDAIFWGTYKGFKKEKNDIIFEFNIIESLKGAKPKTYFYSINDVPSYLSFGGVTEDAVKHNDLSFWLLNFDRVGYSSDCNIYPRFETGKKYLIFDSDADFIRKYEEVDSEKDPWIVYIKNLLVSKDPKPILTNSQLMCGLKKIEVLNCSKLKYQEKDTHKQISACATFGTNKIVGFSSKYLTHYLGINSSNKVLLLKESPLKPFMPPNTSIIDLFNSFLLCQ